MIDIDFLKALTEVPSVGTACGPVIRLMKQWLGESFHATFVSDGFCLFQKEGGIPADLRAVFVAHLDEVGGCVYGPRSAEEGGGFHTRVWGNAPGVFAAEQLQAYDYLADTLDCAYDVRPEIISVQGEERMALHGDHIRPYRTGWTFKQETTFSGDTITGKALDPRVTAYAVAEAVKRLDSHEVAACFVMAEECAMDVARKAVTFLDRNAPNLELIANADVPGINNIGEGRLDLPAIRVFEGRNFIDPSFGIHVTDVLQSRGVELHLSAARSGSQTLLFTPLAPTLSIALPSSDVHRARYDMSLKGTERCIRLLEAIGEGSLNGEL